MRVSDILNPDNDVGTTTFFGENQKQNETTMTVFDNVTLEKWNDFFFQTTKPSIIIVWLELFTLKINFSWPANHPHLPTHTVHG